MTLPESTDPNPSLSTKTPAPAPTQPTHIATSPRPTPLGPRERKSTSTSPRKAEHQSRSPTFSSSGTESGTMGGGPASRDDTPGLGLSKEGSVGQEEGSSLGSTNIEGLTVEEVKKDSIVASATAAAAASPEVEMKNVEEVEVPTIDKVLEEPKASTAFSPPAIPSILPPTPSAHSNRPIAPLQPPPPPTKRPTIDKEDTFPPSYDSSRDSPPPFVPPSLNWNSNARDVPGSSYTSFSTSMGPTGGSGYYEGAYDASTNTATNGSIYSHNSHREPELVSIEDTHIRGPIVREVADGESEDDAMEGILDHGDDESRERGRSRRAQTPGPPNRHLPSTPMPVGLTIGSRLEADYHQKEESYQDEEYTPILEQEGFENSYWRDHYRWDGSHRYDISRMMDWSKSERDRDLSKPDFDTDADPWTRNNWRVTGFGPGINPSRMIYDETHHRTHGAFVVMCQSKEDKIITTSLQNAGFNEERIKELDLLAEESIPGPHGRNIDWMFCPKCWAWLSFGYIYPNEYRLGELTEDYGNPAIPSAEPYNIPKELQHLSELAKHHLPKVVEDLGPDADKEVIAFWAERLASGDEDTRDHHRIHHFHKIPSGHHHYLPQNYYLDPPQSMTTFPTPLTVNPDPALDQKMDLFICCQCPMAWIRDKEPSIKGCFTPDLIERIEKRDSQKYRAEARVREALATCHSILFALLVLKEPRYVVEEAFLETIGPDDLGREIVARLGLVFESPHHGIGLSIITSDEPNEKKWMMRCFIEISGVLINQYNWDSEVRIPFGVEVDTALGTETARGILKTACTTERNHYKDIIRRPRMDKVLRTNLTANVAKNLNILGVSSTDTPAMIHSALLGQCYCDPDNGPLYMTAIENLAKSSFFINTEREDLYDILKTEKNNGAATVPEFKGMLKGISETLVDIPWGEARTVLGDAMFLYELISDTAKASLKSIMDSVASGELTENDAKAKRRLLYGYVRDVAKAVKSDHLYKLYEDLKNSADPLMDALEKIGKVFPVTDDINEEGWDAAFTVGMLESEGKKDWEKKPLVEAFMQVAVFNKYEGLMKRIETESGVKPPKPKAVPVGLTNIGNTCYLNSLLQYLFAIGQLRDAVLKLAACLKVDSSPKTSQPVPIGGRLVKPAEIEKALSFTTELANLFQNMISSKDGAVRPERRLAYLALLPGPASSSPTPVAPEVTTATAKAEESVPNEQVEGLATTTATTATTDAAEVSIPAEAAEQPTAMEVDNPSVEVSAAKVDDYIPIAQADVDECMRTIFDMLEISLMVIKGHDLDVDLIKKLFYGRSKQTLYLGQDATNNTEAEPSVDVSFNSVILAVTDDQGPRDLYDGLNELYFGRHEVEVAGKGGKKTESLESLPPLLHVQLQRTQFDRTKGAYKSNAFVKYEKSLFLDRYMPDGDVEKRRVSAELTQQIMEAMNRWQELKFGKDLPASETGGKLLPPVPITKTLGDLCDYVTQLKDEPEADLGFESPEAMKQFLDNLKEEKKLLEEEIVLLEKEVTQKRQQVHELWKDDKLVEYELSSVFIHRGQVGYGHYWLYQTNIPEDSIEYFNFNDETVKNTYSSEVFKDSTGINANPYLLVYVKKDTGLIDVQTRRGQEEPPAEAAVVPPVVENEIQIDPAILAESSQATNSDVTMVGDGIDEHAAEVPKVDVEMVD